jgi:hypothetical protein
LESHKTASIFDPEKNLFISCNKKTLITCPIFKHGIKIIGTPMAMPMEYSYEERVPPFLFYPAQIFF